MFENVAVSALGQAVHFDNVSCATGTLVCFLMAVVFVVALHAVSSKARNDPETIKRRFTVAILASLAFPFITWSLSSSDGDSVHAKPILHWFGLRLDSVLPGVILPVLLTVLAYFGPVLQELLCLELRVSAAFKEFLDEAVSLIGLRNFIIAPFAEEAIFRSCMIPLLLHSLGPLKTILVSPLFFGVAHVHHVIEQLQAGENDVVVWLGAAFRVLYTTIFGAYSAFLFLRTGHFLSAFVCHMFCNIWGVPDFGGLVEHKQRIGLAVAYLAGVVAFSYLLFPLTDPVMMQSPYQADLTYS